MPDGFPGGSLGRFCPCFLGFFVHLRENRPPNNRKRPPTFFPIHRAGLTFSPSPHSQQTPTSRQPVYGHEHSRCVPVHSFTEVPANRTLGPSAATYAGMRSDASPSDPIRVARSSVHLLRDSRQVAVSHRHEAIAANPYSQSPRHRRPSDGLPGPLEPCRCVVDADQVRRVASLNRRLNSCRDPRHAVEVAPSHSHEPVVHHVDAEPAGPDPPLCGAVRRPENLGGFANG